MPAEMEPVTVTIRFDAWLGSWTARCASEQGWSVSGGSLAQVVALAHLFPPRIDRGAHLVIRDPLEHRPEVWHQDDACFRFPEHVELACMEFRDLDLSDSALQRILRTGY